MSRFIQTEWGRLNGGWLAGERGGATILSAPREGPHAWLSQPGPGAPCPAEGAPKWSHGVLLHWPEPDCLSASFPGEFCFCLLTRTATRNKKVCANLLFTQNLYSIQEEKEQIPLTLPADICQFGEHNLMKLIFQFPHFSNSND